LSNLETTEPPLLPLNDDDFDKLLADLNERIGGMTTKEIIKKTYHDNAIPKKVTNAFYLEWKSLFLRTRNASKEMFREIISILIPGVNLDHQAVVALQTRAMANFNNYRNRFNNAIETLAQKFIEARNA